MYGQFFAALLDPEMPPPSGLVTWNGSDPMARFAVYRNNVAVSLIDALATTYPVTLELVGKEFFHAMARVYVQQEPPRSRVLVFYGESFPDFIEQFLPAASVPYLADTARLEMLQIRAYHAADAGGLTAEDFQQFVSQTDLLSEIKIEFHPSVQILCSQYAVVSLWAAHQGIHELSTVNPYIPESVLILRSRLDVEVIRLNTGSGDFINRLMQGTNLGDALNATSLEFIDFDLAETIGLFIRTQSVSAIKVTSTKNIRRAQL